MAMHLHNEITVELPDTTTLREHVLRSTMNYLNPEDPCNDTTLIVNGKETLCFVSSVITSGTGEVDAISFYFPSDYLDDGSFHTPSDDPEETVILIVEKPFATTSRSLGKTPVSLAVTSFIAMSDAEANGIWHAMRFLHQND